PGHHRRQQQERCRGKGEIEAAAKPGHDATLPFLGDQKLMSFHSVVSVQAVIAVDSLDVRAGAPSACDERAKRPAPALGGANSRTAWITRSTCASVMPGHSGSEQMRSA